MLDAKDATAPMLAADSTAQQGRAKGSTSAAFLSYVKQMFGAGILALPHAFTWVGLTGGILSYVVILVICTYSQVLLVWCFNAKSARAKPGDEPLRSYAGLARVILGRPGYLAVGALVVLLESCFCTGWLIVSADHLQNVFPGAMSRAEWVMCLLPIVLGLSCIPFLAQLWPLSAFGLVVYLVGVIGNIFIHIAIDSDHAHVASPAGLSSLPQFMGTALYSLESILMVVPITLSLRQPEQAAHVVALGLVES